MTKAALTFGFLVVFSSVTAAADPPAHYHASVCKEAGHDTGAFDWSEYRVTRVASTGSGAILCPIVHDFLTSQTIVTLFAIDTDPVNNISCTLQMHDLDGSILQTVTASTSGASTSRQNLDFTMSGHSSTASLVLRCSMPTNNGSVYTKIFGYYVTEQ